MFWYPTRPSLYSFFSFLLPTLACFACFFVFFLMCKTHVLCVCVFLVFCCCSFNQITRICALLQCIHTHSVTLLFHVCHNSFIFMQDPYPSVTTSRVPQPHRSLFFQIDVCELFCYCFCLISPHPYLPPIRLLYGFFVVDMWGRVGVGPSRALVDPFFSE